MRTGSQPQRGPRPKRHANSASALEKTRGADAQEIHLGLGLEPTSYDAIFTHAWKELSLCLKATPMAGGFQNARGLVCLAITEHSPCNLCQSFVNNTSASRLHTRQAARAAYGARARTEEGRSAAHHLASAPFSSARAPGKPPHAAEFAFDTKKCMDSCMCTKPRKLKISESYIQSHGFPRIKRFFLTFHTGICSN